MLTKSITVNGRKIRYLFGGQGKKLLFLHGWPATPLLHKESLEPLSRHFKIYAPYLWDFKCSTCREIAGNVKLFAQELGLKDLVVVGSSFGAIPASILASEKQFVSKLLLISPAGVPRQASAGKMFIGFLQGISMLVLEGKPKTAFYRLTAPFGIIVSLGPSKMWKLIGELKIKNAYNIFKRVKVATTIVWAKRDDMFPRVHAKTLKTIIKKSNLIVVNGAHTWSLHNPEFFAKTIVEAAK